MMVRFAIFIMTLDSKHSGVSQKGVVFVEDEFAGIAPVAGSYLSLIFDNNID